MNKFILALTAVAAIVLGFGAPAHAQYGGDPGVVTVSPPTVVPGGNITVTVSNCSPGERVDISVAGISVSVTCGPDAVASSPISLPATPGTFTGTAIGSLSGFNTSFVVTILAPVTPPGGLPATGSGGIGTTTGMAAGLFAVGLGLFGVTQLRRRRAVVA